MNSLSVFLCYSPGDKSAVRDLYHHLNSDGIDVWLDDEKILPGQDRLSEIKRAVKRSDIIIVCLSTKSVTQEGLVQKLIKQALDVADEKLDDAIFIIPALLEDCAIPERLQKWQWVDLTTSKGYDLLIKSLNLRTGTLKIEASVSRSSSSLPRENKNAQPATFRPEPLVKKENVAKDIPEVIRVHAGAYRSGITEQQVDLIIRSVFSGKYNLDDSPQAKENFKGILKSDAKPREFFVPEFYIGKYPVTNQEFAAFAEDTGHKTEAESKESNDNWRRYFRGGTERYPVVYVSWNDAVAYCNWLSTRTSAKFRLPTLDEWMKVVRGPEGWLYPWGNAYDPSRCNSQDSMRGFETTEVGLFEGGKNYCGVYDLVGNIDEWTMSSEHGYKVILGSSWNMACEIYGLPFFKRRSPPSASTNDLGFRVACA